jgi:hypothetical protein
VAGVFSSISGGTATVPVALPSIAANVLPLAVLSNGRQMHNPCNGCKLTPIRAVVWRPF